ncbi:hypothetical protein [Alicyclobacillus acidoterrestris]|uniref:Uncharacterized protein n=1 Tax=Alicyclobacillus acidoterrestris (strain ATCC 49025 / DSM 3922 / CIP 106132 / NCIMB 13137 / GD3B) TaxID=1356854 RepID=T0C9K1_ALIAG|nr:hypothetical protein [Alicyclobacillus acidoterrestris]EPZ52853.1 hypothetical protein N007_19285 [Alicyclobacillus acidoterrestris ATCC 49025]UNO47835.1 hypothetical protein K1I37_14225 [Alicyclobacillus acidoterrestris]GEO27609.1 hypothetical protein AAC03nite_33940 [Alicyclobacillus acidoterrestris]
MNLDKLVKMGFMAFEMMQDEKVQSMMKLVQDFRQKKRPRGRKNGLSRPAHVMAMRNRYQASRPPMRQTPPRRGLPGR